MGQNFGSIYIKKKAKLTQQKVYREIDAYWSAQGATRQDAGTVDVQPLHLYEGGSRLSLAVSVIKGDWIAVVDSERYTASQPLAVRLPKVLGTEVLWFEICDAANQEITPLGNCGISASRRLEVTRTCTFSNSSSRVVGSLTYCRRRRATH